MYAYCVEHGIFVYDDATYSGSISNENQELGITKEMMDKVKAIAYYGYQYGNHTDDKWYAITQVLIWKTIYPHMGIYYTDSFRGNNIEVYQEEENEILNLVNNHYTYPSFSGDNKRIKLGDTLRIQDTNNILNNYEIIGNDLVDAEIKDNNLIITPKKKGSTKLTLKRKTNRFSTPLILWMSPTSQDMVTPGNIDTIEINLNIDVYDTKVEINKIGEDVTIENNSYKYINVSLKDVVFELYADNDIYDNGTLKYKKNDLINTYKTDKNGHILINDLYYSNYRLTEISSSLNNEILKEDIYFSLVEDSNNISLNIDNKLDRKTLEFTKVDSVTNEPLPNTLIEIYTSDNKLIYKGETDDSGKIIIDDLFIGDFYIKEIESPNGYKLSDNVINFSITKDDYDIINIVMTNEKINGIPNTFKNDNTKYQILFGELLLGVIYAYSSFKKKYK